MASVHYDTLHGCIVIKMRVVHLRTLWFSFQKLVWLVFIRRQTILIYLLTKTHQISAPLRKTTEMTDIALSSSNNPIFPGRK